ncbi:sensor histidine kinase [Catenisphaera adipataccumulans]|uniref:histidine kinase n=1 Tax=Catenisphaera adipataccumulans TaxID=700500 RepID=A0A7W8CW39_9FIRM|nr:HAMP domain-containing sensor histidine kinase [Catenisphaera adipataccumulans]MBB5182691.1 signal transduction histidine kinase [Catenisphaera adipataccumulans]
MIERIKTHRIQSVKSRIFYLNALMTLVTVAICGGIGVICVKLYWDQEERVLKDALDSRIAEHEAERLIENLTVHNGWFILAAVVFAALSILTLILVSRFFSMILTKKIMEPLDLLEQGAQRIRANDYSVPVVYQGDKEFEQVCDVFNGMQQHLKEEKEKNARYEKARQEMVAGISHDLRSPLTAIRGAVKAMIDGVVKEPEQQKKFLQAAYRRSGEMDTLLSELFYFSKLETGGIPVQVQELNLSEYLRNYIDAKKDLPDYADVEFTCDLPEEELKPAQADPEALQRILDNILSNSKKYAGVSPLRFYVSLQQEEDGQRILIQDNGGGVPKEKLGRLFDEFYRVDESRGRKEGSGLGLYIVKYLCEAMGGQVSADMESHCEGFGGLAVSFVLKEGEIQDGGEGQNTDR